MFSWQKLDHRRLNLISTQVVVEVEVVVELGYNGWMEPQCVRVFKCVVFTRLNNPGQVRRGDQQVEKKQHLGFQIIFNQKSKIPFERRSGLNFPFLKSQFRKWDNCQQSNGSWWYRHITLVLEQAHKTKMGST